MIAPRKLDEQGKRVKTDNLDAGVLCCSRLSTRANPAVRVSFCVSSMGNCGASLLRSWPGEKPGHTLQPMALVHDAWLRLVDAYGNAHFESRAHFFSVAAEARRCLLIDGARDCSQRGEGLRKIASVAHSRHACCK